MMYSLIKILAFVAVIIAVTLGVIWLMGLEGGASGSIAGYGFNLTVMDMAGVAVVLMILGWLLFKLLKFLIATFHFLNGDETAISRYFVRNREQKGFEAMGDTILALASGEGKAALGHAQVADRYLDRPALTGLLTAQAAELAGDSARAEETYKALLTDDRTRFVGVRGLLAQKLEKGDTETALKLAETAFTLKPRHDEVQNTLLRLQAETGDWGGARETLNAKLKSGTVPRDVHRRRDAVLALSEAKEVLEDGNTVEARETAIEANRLSPDLIPATVLAARSYIESGKPKYATRILRKAWETQPHPDLARAFAEIAPDEDTAARLKRFRALTTLKPDHVETKILLTELNIAAEDFPEAKRALGDLVEERPTARVLTLMAAVERGEGADDAIVRGWLTRALTAPRGEQWICDNCSHIHSSWEPVCENCHGFDTLSWRRPAEGEISMPSQADMLPLLVGAPAAASSAVAVVEDVVADEVPMTDVSEAEITDDPIILDAEPDDLAKT